MAKQQKAKPTAQKGRNDSRKNGKAWKIRPCCNKRHEPGVCK